MSVDPEVQVLRNMRARVVWLHHLRRTIAGHDNGDIARLLHLVGERVARLEERVQRRPDWPAVERELLAQEAADGQQLLLERHVLTSPQRAPVRLVQA